MHRRQRASHETRGALFTRGRNRATDQHGLGNKIAQLEQFQNVLHTSESLTNVLLSLFREFLGKITGRDN